jgi:hypothetical protein
VCERERERERRYCNGEKIYLNILMELHVFSTPEYEKVDFGMPSLHMDGYLARS